MDFRGKFSIPQPEEIPLESSWMPATPKKPPILVRSNSVLESPNGNLVPGGMANWIEPASNNNCFAEIFNTNPQADQIPARFGCDGNPNANGIAGSYQQQSLLDEGVDWNNISFMQLLQEGDNPDLAASTNRTLTGDVQAAAERPLMPIQRPEMSNFRGDCSSSGGLSSGSSLRPEMTNAHCQVERSWIGLLHREGNQCPASDLSDNGKSFTQETPVKVFKLFIIVVVDYFC